mgnify:CR=1 FL=1
MDVRLVTADEVDVLVAHLARQLEDDSRLREPVSPRGRFREFDRAQARRRRLDGWKRDTTEASWARAWGAWDGEAIVGHAELHASELPTASHRGTLGLAVEAHARRRGVATALMTALLDWARGDENVSWIDLGVFANNPVAEALYRGLGFHEIGRTHDCFRVDGFVITDISMTLNVDE